jgi:energy-coupling factor transporter ATP-binding protein EcfA2
LTKIILLDKIAKIILSKGFGVKKLEPLQSSVGQPAEGEKKYFPRDQIIKKILRKLEAGEHILISAPRRIGKSTILKNLVKNHPQNHIMKYMIVQSVDTPEEFFKNLYNELIDDAEIFNGIGGYIKRRSAAVKNYINRIKGLTLSGSVQLGEEQPIDYYEESIELIKSFKTDKIITIFIDEFPDAVGNILGREPQTAVEFLQKNRDLRMLFSDKNIRFAYTGSTGLKNVVKKIDKLDLINDLYSMRIPPLSEKEARTLIQRLVLGYQQEIAAFEIHEETINYILDQIHWKLPYYMQIITDMLFEYYEETEQKITNQTVDQILKEIVKSKSNYADYFENWKGRLKRSFKEREEYSFAIEVLNTIAISDSISYSAFYDLSIKFNVSDHRYILDVLEHDGYISEDDRKYGFNSILLKEWWYINVAI